MTAISQSTSDELVGDLIDRYLPTYDVAITEHLVVDAPDPVTFDAARDLDFMSVKSPLLAAAFLVRGLPDRLKGHRVEVPPELRFATGELDLPGWLSLGEVPGREIAFGAVGKFWKAEIEWRTVGRDEFAGFDEPGWGKIACHFLVRPDGEDRCVLSYECRTATTDEEARRRMARYWWLIRPFVGHVLRATLSTIAVHATATTLGVAAST